MSYELQPYEPAVHAGPAPQYEQSHVVVGQVPLTSIEYDPRDDEIAEFIGDRIPGSCPRFDDLAAEATVPPIDGADKNQQLKIPCILRIQAHVGIIAYPLCVAKTALLSINPDAIPASLVAEKGGNRLGCPFMYLGGTVMNQEGNQVKVALDAYNPDGEVTLETI